MARPADRVATDVGGWIEPPPITRADATAILNAEVPEASWSEIEDLYSAIRANLAALASSVTATAWPKKVEKLDALLDAVERALRDIVTDPAVIDGLASSVERETGAQDFGGAVRDAVADSRGANDRLRAVLAYSKNPALLPFRTEADVKKVAARRLRTILAASGLPVRLTPGWERDRPPEEPLSDADLTGFERLTEALGIHVADSPRAQAEWLADALRDNSSRRRK